MTTRDNLHDDLRTRPLGEDLAAPPADRWFEDYPEGGAFCYGHLDVAEAEIIRYADRYDPQPIHNDPEFAARGLFGGIIASGMHTVALASRIMIDHYMSAVASMASPGIEEIRFVRPVFPGDRLWVRIHVLSTRVSRSKPDRGLVRSRVDTHNQDDQVVASFVAVNFLGRRPG
jgi:acyl dehydratase